MKTKLTLRLEENLIAAAKAEAGACGVSLSQMVANFFKGLCARKNATASLGPATSRLLGMARHAQLDEKDYRERLARKHS